MVTPVSTLVDPLGAVTWSSSGRYDLTKKKKGLHKLQIIHLCRVFSIRQQTAKIGQYHINPKVHKFTGTNLCSHNSTPLTKFIKPTLVNKILTLHEIPDTNKMSCYSPFTKFGSSCFLKYIGGIRGSDGNSFISKLVVLDKIRPIAKSHTAHSF